MLGRVSRKGGGVKLKGALHPDQIGAVVSSLLCDIESVVRYDDHREAWKDVFRDIAAKSTLPIETYETFLAWRAAKCYDSGPDGTVLHIPHKSNRSGFYEVLAAWWQKLGLIPKGNAQRFANIASRMHWKRHERKRTRGLARDQLGENFPNWYSLEAKIRQVAHQGLRQIGVSTDDLILKAVYGRPLRGHVFVPRTKAGRIRKNHYVQVKVGLDWYRRVYKRGWSVIDGHFIFDWRESARGIQVAYLVEKTRPKDFLTGIRYLDLSSGVAQMAGRETLLSGHFAFPKD